LLDEALCSGSSLNLLAYYEDSSSALVWRGTQVLGVKPKRLVRFDGWGTVGVRSEQTGIISWLEAAMAGL